MDPLSWEEWKCRVFVERSAWKRAYWHIRRLALRIPDWFRAAKFRLRHGFQREDAWSLDDATARFLAPRLRYLAEHHMGYPSEFDGEDGAELWTAILAKMADGFERMANDYGINKGNIDYVDECLDLFREFFYCLWD